MTDANVTDRAGVEVVAASNDAERLARPAAFTLGAQAFRIISMMLLTVLISRFLGPEALGLLALGLTLTVTAAIVASLGVDQGVLYFAARAQPDSSRGRRSESPGAAAGWVGPPAPFDLDRAARASPSAPAAARTALAVAAAGGLVMGLLAWLLAAPVAHQLFNEPDLQGILEILAPAIPVTALLAASLGAVQGAFRVVQRAAIEWVGVPLLTLALAAAMLVSGTSINGVALSYLIAWIVSSLIAMTIALRIPGARRPLIFRPLLAVSLPLMLSLLTGYLLFHVDVLMLGGLADAREVGLYSVATRLALPLFLVLDSVARAFAPLVAFLYARERIERLGSVYASATEWILAINVPIGILIAIHAEPILALFGPEFLSAATALRVLCLGIVVATACGSAGSMLTMTRWQRLEMLDNLLLLAINIALNVALIPRLGALGAAIATATSAAGVFALKALQAAHLISVQPFRRRQLSSVFLGVLAALTAWLATRPLQLPPLAELAAHFIIFTVVYSVLWWRFGCSATGREVVRAILRNPTTDHSGTP